MPVSHMLCTRKTGVTLTPRWGDLLFIKDLYIVMVERFRITLTANVDLYHVTMASYQGFPLLHLSLTVLYFYKKNYSFHIIFIHKNCFGLLFCFVLFVCLFVCLPLHFNFCLKKFSTRICRLTFTITVTLNLSNDPYSFGVFYILLLLFILYYYLFIIYLFILSEVNVNSIKQRL